MTLFAEIKSTITSQIADSLPILFPPPSTLRTFTLYIGRPPRLLEQRIECDLAGLINPYWLCAFNSVEEIIMEIIDVVRKLVGPVEPVGETGTDNNRFENLKVLAKLVDMLIADIDSVTCNKSRMEYSMKRAGEYADKFMDDLGIVR
jgi:hypothetical protein